MFATAMLANFYRFIFRSQNINILKSEKIFSTSDCLLYPLHCRPVLFYLTSVPVCLDVGMSTEWWKLIDFSNSKKVFLVLRFELNFYISASTKHAKIEIFGNWQSLKYLIQIIIVFIFPLFIFSLTFKAHCNLKVFRYTF